MVFDQSKPLQIDFALPKNLINNLGNDKANKEKIDLVILTLIAFTTPTFRMQNQNLNNQAKYNTLNWLHFF